MLHFEFTTQPFFGMEGGRSACEQVIRRLRGHLPDYKKNEPAVYGHCSERLEDALRNAEKLGPKQRNPVTEVGKLVLRLQGLRIDSG